MGRMGFIPSCLSNVAFFTLTVTLTLGVKRALRNRRCSVWMKTWKCIYTKSKRKRFSWEMGFILVLVLNSLLFVCNIIDNISDSVFLRNHVAFSSALYETGNTDPDLKPCSHQATTIPSEKLACMETH